MEDRPRVLITVKDGRIAVGTNVPPGPDGKGKQLIAELLRETATLIENGTIHFYNEEKSDG